LNSHCNYVAYIMWTNTVDVNVITAVK